MKALELPTAPQSYFKGSLKNSRILVVDDNQAIHEDFQRILGSNATDAEFDAEEAAMFGNPVVTRRPAFELSFALQGREALDLVRDACRAQRRYALVFLDMRMPPGWDGLETALKLWEADRDLQIVICTAYSDKSWEEVFERIGDCERLLILKKPFDTIEVLQLAHALTEKWSLLQASRRNLEELEHTVSARTRELLAANALLNAEIAKHKAANERVREQAMLLQNARDAIIVHGLNGKVSFWNQGAERLYGWSSKEAFGGSYATLFGSNMPAEAFDAVRNTGGWTGELSQKTKEGHSVTVECHLTLVRDDAGQPKSIMAINTDITEKKLIEAKFLRSQRVESIGTLASGIAHDLNNILQPVTLGVDLLRNRLPDEDSQQILGLMSTNSERATVLIRQLLSFSRGVEGNREPIAPELLLAEMENVVRGTFPKSIEFGRRSAKGLWTVTGDLTQLHQVLLNLCVNARDAMPAGGRLSLKAENAAVGTSKDRAHVGVPAGNYVVLTVTDSGAGIPPGLLDKIFDPFFTTKPQGQGTGLGLSTSYGIIRSHGGFITIDSKVDRGTTFRIFLPANCEQEEIETKAKQENADSAILKGNGEVILVVDDEAPILNTMKNALEKFGYQVLSANNGAVGAELYMEHQGRIDAVISDICMPVMDGPTMLARLKEANPNLKVLVTTGMAPESTLEALTQLGIDRIMPKPSTISNILRTLREILAA